MGCWEETCGLTSAPIYVGEPCVMIILDREWTERIRKFGTPLGFLGSTWQWKPFLEIRRGTYNDYGWIRELDAGPYKSDGPLPQCLFFHQGAWDWAAGLPEEPHRAARREHERRTTDEDRERFQLSLGKDPCQNDGDFLVFTTELLEFQRVCDVATLLRRDVFSGLTFQGSQEWLPGDIRQDFLRLQTDLWKRQQEMLSEN